MKLSKRILSVILCMGMLSPAAFSMKSSNNVSQWNENWDMHWDRQWSTEWDEQIFESMSLYLPKNLDECCHALDEIFRDKEEIKEKIKHSSCDFGYLRFISNTNCTIGYKTAHYWLYLPEPNKEGESRRRRPSPLAELFYAHNVDFSGEAYHVMVSIIFENYRYYLINGKSRDSIEELAIEHWYNVTGHYKSREELREYMRRWPEVKAAHYNALNNKCNIL